jgi:ABC-type branched-subunit amino acid transport system ATPase component
VIRVEGLAAGVVRDLGLAVAAGEVVALIGPASSGKTTVLRTLAGEVAPAAGTVRVDGVEPGAPMHRRVRRSGLAVLDGTSPPARLTVAQCARAAGVGTEQLLARFPELGAVLDHRIADVAIPERRLVAAGIALARSPRVLLADEATAGLPPDAIGRVLAGVRAAADAGTAAVVVDQYVHRLLEVADRVVVLRRGRVEFTGTAAEALDRLAGIEAAYVDSAPIDLSDVDFSSIA